MERVRIGVNFWQAAWIGADDPERLERELDQLAAAGVSTVRLFAGAEGPDDAGRRVVPAIQPAPGEWNEELLVGLERALDALHARAMHATICMGNFWSWSGGIAQYRVWAGNGPAPEPLDHREYQVFAAGFYRDAEARALFDAHVAMVVERFRAAPAVALWQILNEPRGIEDPEGMRAFLFETAANIRALDPERDITTGSEGSTANPEWEGLDFALDHADPNITVCTCHLWPENWGLWDPREADQAQLAEVFEWSRAYLRRHAEIAAELGKPLHLEELGLARDGRRLDAGGTTEARDRFFDTMLREAKALTAEGLPVREVSFWAWSGEALVVRDDPATRGGDPPHEPSGWYGIGSGDESTLAVFREHR